MKKIALLGMLLISHFSYTQKTTSFESIIKNSKSSIVEGCLDYHYGPYPTETFTPKCDGREEEIFLASGYGTFSNVNVTAGVEYNFITYSLYNEVKTAFITISNEAGTEVYASGYDTLNWTPTKNEVIRYYIHSDNQCGRPDGFVKKYIRCGAVPPEPSYGCDQSYNGPYLAACSVSGEAGFLVADDFFVPRDSEVFKLRTLKFLLIPLAMIEDFKNFTIEIRKDFNNSPGDVVTSFENLTATEIVQHTENFLDYPTFWTTLTIPNNGFEIPVDKEQNTRYWITLQVWSKSYENIALAGFSRINNWLTQPSFQSLDNKKTWITTSYQETPGLESIWSFDADCSKLSSSDTEDTKFTYYPNPIKDILNISSKVGIKEVTIRNYTGQKLMTFTSVKNGKINISNLASGTYLVTTLLENGSIKTFKIIKK